MRVVRAGLQPVVDEVHEGQACELILSIRNAFPLPLWGLVIEGYLDREGDDVQPTTALACVPGLSQADYRLAVCPSLRGRYPVVKPMIACAFPFGIWTARRSADDCSPLTVLPKSIRFKMTVNWTAGNSPIGEKVQGSEPPVNDWACVSFAVVTDCETCIGSTRLALET